MNSLALVPFIFWFPVTVYSAPSPSANPSPLTVTSSFVRGLPSNSFCADPDVRVTSLLAIVRVPFSVFTANCSVTSFPSSSVTAGVPVTLTGYSPAFVPDALAVSPLTVYVSPFTVKVSVFNPLTLFSVPSYFSLPLFASTVISYLAVLFVTVRVPSFFVML